MLSRQLGVNIVAASLCLGSCLLGKTTTRRMASVLVCYLLWVGGLYAQTVTVTLGAGSTPFAVGINPVTNKIYVANVSSNTVTIIDGATNSTTSVASGSEPVAVAVNPVTNRIYVANYSSHTVTVIDGSTNATTTINVGTQPQAVAVNPVTDKIYVANEDNSTVTVIDGASNATTTVNVGSGPFAIAVNPVTNKIYVANYFSHTVSVIDGVTNSLTTVSVGGIPFAVSVNPVTNRIYVANYSSNTVTAIDGATNATTSIVVGSNPAAVVVNPVTNRIYVANYSSNSVTIIDGATNSTTSVVVGTNPAAVAVNPVTNQIYAANAGSNTVTVVDGATNATLSVAVGSQPHALAINPTTNKIYVPNRSTNDVTVVDGATYLTANVTGESNPRAAVVNPVTNKIYVTNYFDDTVSVIDGATNSAINVAAGNLPIAVALNPITNKIFVANKGSGTVTVIDGATNTTASVVVGNTPVAIALNPVTNKIYVANINGNTVTVIDGITNGTTTVAVGALPVAVAVNPQTNKIYVANESSDAVTVIDGATNTTATIGVGTQPQAVAVNPVTNRIYTANYGSNTVTVIEGATNATTSVVVGTHPVAVDVNPVSNKIYVVNVDSNNMTVIDGATNTTASIGVDTQPQAVAVNPGTNKIYIANYGGNTVSVIDGATNSRTTVVVGTTPIAIALDRVTNKIYVANFSSNTVTVITEQQINSVPLLTTITPFANDTTSSTTPTFTFTAESSYSPIAAPVQDVYYQVDSWQGAWFSGIPQGGGIFQGTSQALTQGIHIAYAFAVDGQDATSINTDGSGWGGTSPIIGEIHAYLFLVAPYSTPDADGDGVSDSTDNCPNTPNAAQVDADNDGIGDVCDACSLDVANDADADGICGNVDNCPGVANANQSDADGDGVGDVCDNCVSVPNPSQLDTNPADTIGDACESDLSVTKTGPAAVCPGAPITYTITATNNGPGFEQGATLSDSIPSSLAFATTAITDSTQSDFSGDFDCSGGPCRVQWSTTNSWLELNPGIPGNISGSYTSRVFDAGSAVQWASLGWLPLRPTLKELPDSKQTESNAYAGGVIDMSGNLLLLHLDETAGATIVTDSSGTLSTPGTVHGGASFGGASKLKTAVTLDGSSGYVDFGSTPELDSIGAFTVSAWLRPDAFIFNPEIVLRKTSKFSLEYIGTQGITLYLYDQSLQPQHGAVAGLGVGDWAHVVGVYDGSSIHLYINGAEYGTPVAVTAGSATLGSLTLGSDQGVSAFWQGGIDEVAIWNRALSAPEIGELYRRGATRLRFQVRSCPDAGCAGTGFVGPDGTNATYFSELQNNTTQPPSLLLGNAVPPNQYFQYRALLDVDSFTLQPELRQVMASYYTGVPVQDGCSVSGGVNLDCSLGAIPYPGQKTISITTTAPSTDGTVSNTATVSGSNTDTNSINNSSTSTTTVACADLALSKSDSPDPVCVGQPLTYTLTATNNGPSDAANVMLTDTMPAAPGFTSMTDDDAGEFNDPGATHSNTVWNGANSVLQIDDQGLLQGTFTSRVFDAGSVVPWDSLSWLPLQPRGKELPNLGQSESGYPTGNADMSNNLLLWHMNEASGDILDSSTNVSPINGLPIGDVTFNAPGVFNSHSSLQFNPASSPYPRIQVDPIANTRIDPGQLGALTLELWFDAFSPVPGPVALLKASNAGDSVGYGFQWSGGSLHFFVHSAGGYYQTPGTGPSVNQWHHVVGVYDGATIALYFDGSLVGTTSTSGSLAPCPAGSCTLLVNGDPAYPADPTRYLTGRIDEVAIYDRALQSSEIQSRYQRGSTRQFFKVRSCGDATCSTDPAWSSEFSESNNTSLTPPSFSLDGAISNSRYLQYQVRLETDQSSLNAELRSVSFIRHDYTSNQGICQFVGSNMTCDIGTIPSGQTVSLQTTVVPSAAGTLDNSGATVSSSTMDPTPANNSATASTVVKRVPDGPIDPTPADGSGICLTPTILLSWASSPYADTYDVFLDGNPVANCQGISATTCVVSGVSAGMTHTWYVQAVGFCGNSTSATWSFTTTADSDADGWGNTCDNCVNVPNPDQADGNNNGIGDACESDVWITKTDSVSPGRACTQDPFTYTITAHNSGPSAAANIVVDDTLPLSFVPTSTTGAFSDDDAADFSAGTGTDAQWNGSWLELDSNGQAAMTGQFISRVFDATVTVPWTTLSWVSQRPTYKELPNSGQNETAYPSGNANMSGIQLLLHLNDLSNPVVDSSGNALNGTSTGGFGASGKLNTSLYFTSSGYVDFTAPPQLDITGPMTVSAWIYASGLPSGPAVVVKKNTAGDNAGYSLEYGAGGMRFYVHSGSWVSTPSAPISPDTWHYIVGVYTGTELQIFSDGSLVGSTPLTGALDSSVGGSLNLARDPANASDFSRYWYGSIDEVAIFNRALDSTEVAAFYRRAATRLKFQVRSCNLSDCSDGTFAGPGGAGTFFTELTNNTVSLPVVNVSLVSPASRYFQYRAVLETDAPSLNAELNSVTASYQSIPTTQGICSLVGSGPTMLTCNLGTLASGGSATITLEGTPTAAGVLSNTATVSSDNVDPVSNNSATQNTTVEDCSDLGVSISDSPDPMVAGDPGNLGYTIRVTNYGLSNATNVVVTDWAPAVTSLVSLPPECTSTNPVTCSLPTLAAGSHTDFVIVVSVPPSTRGTINNHASVAGNQTDHNSSNDTDSENTTVIGVADLELLKGDATDPVLAGQDLAYNMTVKNYGPSTATEIVLTDNLPLGVTFAWSSYPGCSGTTTVTCTLGDIDPGNQSQFQITVAISPDAPRGIMWNSASVQATETDPIMGNNSASEDTGVNANYDVTITKADSVSPSEAIVGVNFAYTLTVSNVNTGSSPSTARNVTVTDTLPPGLAFVSATPAQGGCSGGSSLTCNLGTIWPGATTTVQVVVTPTASAVPSVVNSAHVSADTSANEWDILPGNNDSGSVTTNVLPGLLVNDVSITEGNAGTTNLTFTITLNAPYNAGNGNQTVTVDYDTVDGTAYDASDYIGVTGSLTFTPGQTSKTVKVKIIGDTLYEAHETFFLQLSNPVNAGFQDPTGQGTINNDDGPPTISITDRTLYEGNTGTTSATFTVLLSSVAGAPVSVNFATANVTAVAGSDYNSTSGTLTIPTGNVTGVITVPVIGDAVLEPDETFYVNLSSPVNATLTDNQAVGLILNDDTTACLAPDEKLFLYSVTLTPDANHYAVLNFMDPNQPTQITGYNVYRTDNASLSHNLWEKIASNVIDEDEATPNKQYVDQRSNETPPSGPVWYYEVVAYNSVCGGEGPW